MEEKIVIFLFQFYIPAFSIRAFKFAKCWSIEMVDKTCWYFLQNIIAAQKTLMCLIKSYINISNQDFQQQEFKFHYNIEHRSKNMIEHLDIIQYKSSKAFQVPLIDSWSKGGLNEHVISYLKHNNYYVLSRISK